MNTYTPAVLSFSDVKERDRTKHVHRLHPYKGKFIPQLVEYFLDGHTDEFKQEVYMRKSVLYLMVRRRRHEKTT